MKALIEMAADRGAFIDQSASLNLFMESPTIGKLSSMYMYAWEKGVKTTYYLRSLAASGIEKSSLDLHQQVIQSTIAHEIAETPTAIEPVLVPEPRVVEPVAMAAGADAVVPVKAPMVFSTLSLCKIDDPNCEACQ